MIKAVPEYMAKIDPDDLAIHLVDRPSANAYVIPTESGKFSIYIHRGLLEALLTAPELKNKNMCIDALAGVVAHEICHANFKRQFHDRGNTMLQEEYCDLLPAKMLERTGLRPEAMSLVCDLLSRLSRGNAAQKVAADEPHANHEIRKEIYEKGAWQEYERARRKEQPLSVPRAEWQERIESIVNASKDHRIVSFLEHALLTRGGADASTEKKLSLINQILTEYAVLFSERGLHQPITEAANIVAKILGQEGPQAKAFADHPCLTALSIALYKQGHYSDNTVKSYQRIASILQKPNFGAMATMDAAITEFLQATTKEGVQAAIPKCTKAFSHGICPNLLGEPWGPAIFPGAREQLARIFSSDDSRKLLEGQTIPFPFAAHHQLQAELLDSARTPRGSSTPFWELCKLMDGAGISWASKELLEPSPHSNPRLSAMDPAERLKRDTGCSSLAAFCISQEHGIAMLYPPRVTLNQPQDLPAVIEAEKRYAEFIARRGATLVDEASKLTHEQFFQFTELHGHLIMPQLHPVGTLSESITHDSHKLAQAIMTRFSTLLETAPNDSFRQDALKFLTDFSPIKSCKALRIYNDYHSKFSALYPGPRVDPTHPLVDYILKNPVQLLSRSQQLLSITSLNGFHGGHHHRCLASQDLLKAFSLFSGGDAQLAQLFSADFSQRPEIFIAKLARIDHSGPDWYNDKRWGTPDLAVREIRAQLIQRYLDTTPPERFTLDQLHTLHDLCRGGNSLLTARHIGTIAKNLALTGDLSRLNNDDFVASYQHLVCMGATDRSVQLETACNAEIMRRYSALPSAEAQGLFLNQIIYPKTFSCGEPVPNRIELLRAAPAQVKDVFLISSVYIPRLADPSFERFIVKAAVAHHVTAIRSATGCRYDDSSPAFKAQCQEMLTRFDDQRLPVGIRTKVLQGVADELLLQRDASFLLRDNLYAHSKLQSHLTFADVMTATHQDSKATNWQATQLHNGLVELRSPSENRLRESLFRFFLEHKPDAELSVLTALLAEKLKGSETTSSYHIPRFFQTLGIVGVGHFSTPEERKIQEEIIEYHLRGLHQRFSELDVKSKGAALSALAVDNDPSEQSFEKFKNEVLLPRILPLNGPYNALLLAGINDYFNFYSDALHHKYMVACAILAASRDDSSTMSELGKVGLITKNFLGAHGTAGYKLLQRIRNYPSTPQEIKDVLHNVLDETISLPRWTIHERIAQFGPHGAPEQWIGRAKAGSMCLSVPLKEQDGAESFLSIIHPGAHIDSLYWLQNFTKIALSLEQIDPRLDVLAPMAQQTRHLIKNETDFASSPKTQQRIAEEAYNYTMEFPQDAITVHSSCAPLISSEAKPHPTDTMLNSGNKKAGRVTGRTLLELASELRDKIESESWNKEAIERRFAVLRAAAFSVVANEVRLIASCHGKDHDRHPGNYLIDLDESAAQGHRILHLHHFDFGCTDVVPPSETVRKELGATLAQFCEQVGIFESIFRPGSTTNKLTSTLFEKGSAVPEIAAIPLGLLAATGANERIKINNEERPLLSSADLLRAFKVGLQSADVPQELASVIPSGLKGWFLRGTYARLDTQGISFTSGTLTFE
jgi:hypothetical protein